MIWRSTIAALLIAGSLGSVAAARDSDDIRFYSKPMVADISQSTIQIHAQFDGADLLLYGARNEPGDIIAVVTGPYASVQLSRKDNIAGMWMQVERSNYAHMPLYYAVAATRDLHDILPLSQLKALGITYPDPARYARRGNNDTMNNALKQQLTQHRWVHEDVVPIQYFGETLFRTHLAFPSNMPRGDYTVDVFLVKGEQVVAMQTIPLHAEKTGLDFWLYDMSRNRPWLYGLCAALLSLAGGWLGNRLIRR